MRNNMNKNAPEQGLGLETQTRYMEGQIMALKNAMRSLEQELELSRQREKNAISMLEAVKTERKQLRVMVEQLTVQLTDQTKQRDKQDQALRMAGKQLGSYWTSVYPWSSEFNFLFS